MENKNETKYYFIWLYISLLLHLLLVIIMFAIKPSSSQLTEPDPATDKIDPTQVLFMVDALPQHYDNDEVEEIQIARRTQGDIHGNTSDGDANAQLQSAQKPKEPHDGHQDSNDDRTLDTSNQALTNEFKKGLKDTTIIKDQPLADPDVIIQEKISATENNQTIDIPEQAPEILQPIIEFESNNSTSTVEKTIEVIQETPAINNEKMSTIIASQVTPVIQQKIKSAPITPAKKIAPEPVQKVESKKHRPIEVGLANQSKIELNKDTNQQIAPVKKKFSIQDLNLSQGFSDFVRQGNATFSSTGNADKDNSNGLILVSFLTQLKQNHENAFKCYPGKYIVKADKIPTRDSIINMTIDRTGTITLTPLQSSGDLAYDEYHMKVLQFMGNCCSGIPKYIPAPQHVTSNFECPKDRSFRSIQPAKLQL